MCNGCAGAFKSETLPVHRAGTWGSARPRCRVTAWRHDSVGTGGSWEHGCRAGLLLRVRGCNRTGMPAAPGRRSRLAVLVAQSSGPALLSREHQHGLPAGRSRARQSRAYSSASSTRHCSTAPGPAERPRWEGPACAGGTSAASQEAAIPPGSGTLQWHGADGAGQPVPGLSLKPQGRLLRTFHRNIRQGWESGPQPLRVLTDCGNRQVQEVAQTPGPMSLVSEGALSRVCSSLCQRRCPQKWRSCQQAQGGSQLTQVCLSKCVCMGTVESWPEPLIDHLRQALSQPQEHR